MTELNGTGAPESVQIKLNNPCVDILEQMLRDARAGTLISIAVVGVNQQRGIAHAFAGQAIGDMYLGTSMLQDLLLQHLKTPQPPSRILRPVG